MTARGISICERLFEKSDPRCPLFVSRQLVDPHRDIDGAASLKRCLTTYFTPGEVDSDFSAKLLPLLANAMDNGDWLVIICPVKNTYDDDAMYWCDLFRAVGREIIRFLPEDHIPNRELFRLWVSTEGMFDLQHRDVINLFPAIFLKNALQAADEAKPTRPSSAKIVRRKCVDIPLSEKEDFLHEKRREQGRDSDSESDEEDNKPGWIFYRCGERTGSPPRGSRPVSGAASATRPLSAPGDVPTAIALVETTNDGTKSPPKGGTYFSYDPNPPKLETTARTRFDNAAGDALQKTNGSLVRLFVRDQARAYEEIKYLETWAAQILIDTPSQDYFEVTVPFEQLSLSEVCGSSPEGPTIYRGTYCLHPCIVEVYKPSSLNHCKVFARCLRKLTHPKILQFVGTSSDRNYYCLIREFANHGCVSKILSEGLKDALSHLTLKEFFNIIRDVAVGLLYLHNQSLTVQEFTAKHIFKCDEKTYKLRISDIPMTITNPLELRRDVSVLGYLMVEILTYGKVKYIPQSSPRRLPQIPLELWHNVIRPCFDSDDELPSLEQIITCCEGYGTLITVRGAPTHVSYTPQTKIGI
eukprot:PhF_6_TR25615/c0_g1_i1/m.35965